MRTGFFLAAIGFGLASCQSMRPLYPAGAYATGTAFQQQRPSLAGSDAGPTLLHRKISVDNPAGSDRKRVKISRDSLWGYAKANGRAFRLFRGRPYQIEQADTLMIYSQQQQSVTYLTQRSGPATTTEYFFSSGLNGPVLPLRKKALRQAFATNPAFLRLLKQNKWNRPLLAYNEQTKRFRIVALYQESLQRQP